MKASRSRAQPPGLEAARTARELVHWGEARFLGAGLCFAHGTTNAREEAVLLVFHALGLTYDSPEEALDRPLAAEERARAVALLRARVHTRKPAAYLIGEASFAGLPFYVNEQVLVPRSPIAELCEAAFAPWSREARRILDLGTGSGCIAIACALAFPEAEVEAVDVSPEALAVAERNVARHGLEGRVRLWVSDIYDALGGRRYDLIVSNPPYVPSADLAGLPAEHRHEPALGLDGGDDGLTLVARIIEGAPDHLSDDGILVVEVGDRTRTLEARYPRLPFTWVELEHGGEGVFVLEAETLRRYLAGAP